MNVGSVFLAAGMTVFSAVIFAGTYSGGAGTEADPYRISTAADWLELTASPADWRAWFILTNDVDLSEINPMPVGNNTVRFNGVLDGNHYKLHNMTLALNNENFVGPFGYIGAGGLIKNLRIVNVDVQGHEAVGGLVGRNHGTIRSCYVTGSVRGHYWDTGGLAGSNIGGAITACFTDAAVVSISDYVGGVAGYNLGDAITACYALGTVSGRDYVGGLLGANDKGQVVHCYSVGETTGISEVGGLAGINWEGVITGSFWDIETTGTMSNGGGEGKTTAQMQTQSLYTEAGWDFQNIWTLCEGMDYPRLQWQIPAADFVCPHGVHMEDMAYFAQWWLADECGDDQCAGVDLNGDGVVNYKDLLIFARFWLQDL